MGATISHPELLELVRNDLTPGDFFRVANGKIYAAMLALDESGAPIDLLALCNHLKAGNDLEDVGGPAYVSSMVDGVPKATNVAYYAGIVLDCARKRLAIATLTRLLETAYAASGQADELLEQADRAVNGLRNTNQTIGALGPAQQWVALLEEVKQAPQLRVCLGIPTLDNLLNGIHPGEVCGIMARPSVGKTMILGHMLRAIAERELGIVLFSLEMPAPQIVARLARSIYGYTRYELEDKMRCGLSSDRYERTLSRVVLIDSPGLSLAKMESSMRTVTARLLENKPPAVVIIDHLGLIGGDRTLSTYDRVSTQAREIKELAKRHHVAVLLAIQVNRDIGGDGSRELSLGAARDSGVVEEAMDYLVGCRRLEFCSVLSQDDRAKYAGAIFMKVLKNRHGELGREFAVRVDPNTLEITEDVHLEARHQGDVSSVTRRRA